MTTKYLRQTGLLAFVVILALSFLRFSHPVRTKYGLALAAGNLAISGDQIAATTK